MQRALDTASSIALEMIESTSVLSGRPRAGALSLAAVAGAEVGVWEMTPGTSTDVETDEVFIVLSGSATVAFDDGDVIELAPGSTVRLHAGDRTVWTVHSTLRKIYIS